MSFEYEIIMYEVPLYLGKQILTWFKINGAKSAQVKQIIDNMAYKPKAYPLEHFAIEIWEESADHLL